MHEVRERRSKWGVPWGIRKREAQWNSALKEGTMNQVSWCHKVNETRTEKWSLGRARFRSLVTLMSKMVDETWLAWIEGGFEKRMEKIRNVDYTAECPGRSHSTWKDAISRSWTTYFASPCPIFPICRMQVIIRTSVALKKCGHKLFGTPSIQRKVSVPSIWLREGYNCSNP